MANQFSTPEVVVERYAAVVRSGLELATRRVQAMQDFWAAVPQIREPKDLVAAQSAFWRRAIDDYGAVLRDSIGPLAQPAEQTPPAQETPPAALKRAA